MKILIIHYSEITSPGGVHKTIRETARNLSKKGHEVSVLQGNPLQYLDQEIYEGFKIIRVKSKIAERLYGLSPEICMNLNKIIKNLNPDLIHVHGYHTVYSIGVILTLKLIKSDIPIIFSPHYGVFSHDTFAGKYLWNIHNLIGKYIVKFSDIIIATSNFESRNINNDLNVSNNKIIVIPHGVDTIDIKNKKKNKNTINLLYVGYLLELKGVQHIIETLHELISEKNAGVYLTVIGEGPYENDLRKLANRLNVSEFINWKGFMQQSEVLDYYKNSDIFLLLSQSENYGIVVPEALSMGTPVIVTKRTSLKEFLNEPGCFGVSYPPDFREVADLIIRIYENNQEVGSLSRKIMTWDKVTDDYEKVYNQLLKRL